MEVRANKVTEENGQTDMEFFVGPSSFMMNTGTWTNTWSTRVPFRRRTAANANTGWSVPLNPPGVRQETSRGAKITAIDLYYAVGTEDAADFPTSGITVDKVTAAYGTAAAAATAGGSLTLSLTTTQRKVTASGQKVLTITLGTPAFINDGEMWWLGIDAVDMDTNGVLDIQGAVVKYTRCL